MKVEFTVAGSPHGKGRPQFSTYGGRVHTRTPEKTVVYENLVKVEFQRQCGKSRFSDESMLAVDISAYYDIPLSASNKKKQSMRDGTMRPKKKPDADNVIKTICDSLNGIAYHDDAQVVDVTLHKYYGDEPRTEVVITEIGGQINE